MFQWTVTHGIVLNANNKNDSTRDPLAALDFVMESQEQAVFLFKDLHPFLTDTTLVRRLRDLTYALDMSIPDEERNGVCFYSRPGTPRRAYELAVLSLDDIALADGTGDDFHEVSFVFLIDRRLIRAAA